MVDTNICRYDQDDTNTANTIKRKQPILPILQILIPKTYDQYQYNKFKT